MLPCVSSPNLSFPSGVSVADHARLFSLLRASFAHDGRRIARFLLLSIASRITLISSDTRDRISPRCEFWRLIFCKFLETTSQQTCFKNGVSQRLGLSSFIRLDPESRLSPVPEQEWPFPQVH